ncbi:MAG: XrtA/PEP-CTERM system TPR-repeat protein PrsT [Motiliproteus sp.]
MDFKFCNSIASCILGVALLTGWSEHSLANTEYLQQAKESQAKGDFKSAAIHLKNALQDNPDNREARYLLGQIYVENGYWPGAEKELRKAHQLGGSQALIMAPLAKALVKQGKFDRLLEEIVPTGEMDPVVLGTIYAYRIEAWLALGKIENAATELTKAQQLAPNQPPTYLSQARLAMKQSEWTKARESVQAALDIEPLQGTAWSLLAELERIAGESEKAEIAYGKAIANRTDNSVDYLQRALIRIALKDYTGADNDIKKAEKKIPNHPMTHYVQGLFQFEQQRYAEAQAAFEKVLNKVPNHMEAVFYLGATHLAQDQHEQAEKHLKNFLSTFPQSLQAAKLLATSYNKLDQPERTLDILKPFLDENEPDPQILALAGEAYLLENNPSAAEGAYKQLAERTPNNAALHTRIGLIQLASGEEAKAIESMAAAATNGYNYRADLALAYYHLNVGQFDKALDVVNKLENHLPDNPGVYNLKGQLFMSIKDLTQARVNFEQALTLKPDLVSAALRLAMIDLQENNIPAAKNRYHTILEHDDANVAAMIGLAELAQQEGIESAYFDWLQRATNANPAAIVPRVYLVNYYLDKGEPRKALTVARNGVDARPESPEALALLGLVQQAMKDKEGALTTYRKLTTLSPKSAAAQHQLAKAHAALGQAQGARIALHKALTLDPEYKKTIAALSALEVRTGNHQQALILANKFQKLSPNDPTGLILEGDALMAARRYTDAIGVYQRALTQTTDSRVAIKLHLARLRSGSEDSADEALLIWLNNHPDDSRGHGYLARSFLKRGLDQQAIAQYQILSNLMPEGANAFNNLAILYQRVNDSRSLETAEYAYQLEPDNPVFADTLGWVLVEQGKLTRGLKLLEQAAASDSNNPEIQYHLAYSFAEAGQITQAQQLVKQLQKRDLSPALQDRARQLSDRLQPASGGITSEN